MQSTWEGKCLTFSQGLVLLPTLRVTMDWVLRVMRAIFQGEPASERPLRYCRETVSWNAPDASESTLLTMMR